MAAKSQSRFKGLIGGTAAGAVTIALYLSQAFQAIEYQIYDKNFQWRGGEPAPQEIVIVDIDPMSLEKLGRWPWPRLYHAEIVRGIAQNGAKVIGVDIGFFEPDQEAPQNDAELVAATTEAGNVVYPVVVAARGGEDQSSLLRFKNLPKLTQAAAATGHVHIEHSSDGIVRRVYLSETLAKEQVWSWALEVLRVYLDLPADSIRRSGPGKLTIGNIVIPVQEASRNERSSADFLHDYELNINFVGRKNTFEHVSAYRIIEGDIPDGCFNGKIVLYGGSAAGLWDSHMTPFSQEREQTPGVEVQANVIHTILKERFIGRAHVVLISVLSLLAALIMGAIYEHFETRIAVAFLLLGLATSLAGCVYVFRSQGYWLDVVPIHAALVLSFVFGLMLKMREVNVAMDKEVLNLSQATQLGGQAGQNRVVEVFRSAESTLKGVLGIPAAALLKVDRTKGVMTLAAQYGLNGEREKALRPIKFGSSLRGLLIGLEPIPIDGLGDHPLSAILGKKGSRLYHSLLVPLLAHGETVGVLSVFRPKGSPFTIEERELLQAVSSELGSVWYNSSLYTRLVQITSNPLAPFTYKSQERRIQTLSVLSESVLSEKNLMSAILDSIADGVMVTDVLGTIRIINPKAKDILGLYAEDCVGQNAADFIRRYSDVSYDNIRHNFQQVVEHGRTFTTEIKLALPTTHFYTLSVGPIRSREGLVQGIVGVLSDITELKELDQMKTDLMSMVTHEIRTPLATVRGFAQILLKGGIPTEKSREFLEIINRQSNRLVNLVNDFLDITRIESGRQAVTKAPLNLDKLIQNTITDLKPLADDKSIVLAYDPPSSPVPEVLADRNLMEQVLINLLSNAIKYSPKGRQARVALGHCNGHVRVDVKDNGLGIPRDAVPRLFEKFYRVRSDDRKDIIGTGLGLSLVKQIIEVHEGTISVESEHGVGPTFTVTIPLKPKEQGATDSKQASLEATMGAQSRAASPN